MLRLPPLAAAWALLIFGQDVAAVRLQHAGQQPEIEDEGADSECPESSQCPEILSEEIHLPALKAPAAAMPLAMHRYRGMGHKHNDTEDLDVEPANVSLPHFSSPDMFVAVFSAMFKESRRHAARWAWHSAKSVAVRFIVCKDPPDDVAINESKHYHDIVFLDCEEGYKDGKLTQKLAITMKYFRDTYPKTPFFFKTDDDTFVRSWDLLSLVKQANSSWIYGGLFYGHHSRPNRDPASKWYQPVEVYPENRYPEHCAGGPGYVLSKALVQEILNKSLPERYLLSNEDKAVGVWVKKVEETGVSITKVKVKGTDGYRLNECMSFPYTPWSQYDFVLHHHVTPKAMVCMGRDWRPRDLLVQCFDCDAPRAFVGA